MRVAVTGAMNPFGQAIVRALAEAGHQVRAFGVPAGQDPFGHDNVLCHPGSIEVSGSIEPVLSERHALVHAACLDAPGKDRVAHAFLIERGTLYARYGAEREQLEHFIHVTPSKATRTYSKALEAARRTAEAARGLLNIRVVLAREPGQAAADVVQALERLPALGSIPGANDAVTA